MQRRLMQVVASVAIGTALILGWFLIWVCVLHKPVFWLWRLDGWNGIVRGWMDAGVLERVNRMRLGREEARDILGEPECVLDGKFYYFTGASFVGDDFGISLSFDERGIMNDARKADFPMKR